MTWLDRYLQKWRIRKAWRELPSGARVLDIGTHDGALFRLTGARGTGIDPELAAAASMPGVTLVEGSFPGDLPMPDESFDAVTALAVVEHVPENELMLWAESIARLLVPRGLLIMTVPAPAVDAILHILMRLKLVAGMAAHQHHGFQLNTLDRIFQAPLWHRARHRAFELGLNHVYVFQRAAASATPESAAQSRPGQLSQNLGNP
jgi:SAM-dependent methyltransferase